MSLEGALREILTRYRGATTEPYSNHPLAAFVRGPAKEAVTAALGEVGAGLLVDGSAGAGNWASVPWIAVFDPSVTTTATEGFYVVYLFHATRPVVHLSLNQGTTAVREEFGRRAREILTDRSDLMRKRIAEYASSLPITSIDLGSKKRLPGDYVAGHALGITYDLDTLPGDGRLRSDLQTIVRAYRALAYRGGIDANVDADLDVTEEFGLKSPTQVIETRKYAFHKKVERNRTAARHAKRHHGYICQACGFDFEARYGRIGEGFIEAHHLKPIASLEEGVAIVYDVAADFAVLCSNCHRMIHRSDDPADLGGLRRLLGRNESLE